MVQKVHGGTYKDQVLAGSLRAYAIDLVGIGASVASADAEAWAVARDSSDAVGTQVTYNEGDSVPNSAADLALRVISTRATVVSVTFPTADKMHVLLENASAWGYASVEEAGAVLLGDALNAVGAVADPYVSTAGGATAQAGFAAATAAEVEITFLETPVTGDAGGLGGGEHDQDFGGAGLSPK